MRFTVVFALLLAASIAHSAAQAYPYQFFVPQNASYFLTKFPHENQTAQALIVNGNTLYAIFMPKTAFSTSIEPLTDKGEIASALRSYYSFFGYSEDAVKSFSSVHKGIVATANSSDAGEDRCRILLGTDRHECIDFDSCQKACYSVTSFCQVVALGSGQPFINIIWQFENDSRSLDEAYAREQSAYDAFEEKASANASTDYLLALQNLNVVATRAASNPLYSDYSYCFQPEYNLSEITSLQLAAQRAYKNASHFYLIPFYSEKVRNTTLTGLARKAKYDIEPAPSASPSSTSPQENLSIPQEPPVYSQKEEPAASFLLQAAAISGAFLLFIGAIFALGAWAVFRKKKRPSDEPRKK
ncbi:MAG: hypothetical protein QW568_00255 [Candidatus Anstonellaceae archaeon]